MRRRSAIASGTVSQIPVTTSTVLRSSSLCSRARIGIRALARAKRWAGVVAQVAGPAVDERELPLHAEGRLRRTVEVDPHAASVPHTSVAVATIGGVDAPLRSDVGAQPALGAGGRVQRWRSKLFAVVQCSIAAGVAWWLAADVLDHETPFFAPIAAVVSLGTSYGQRLRRVVEVTFGVAIGVFVADLLVVWIGTGAWQLALIVGPRDVVGAAARRGQPVRHAGSGAVDRRRDPAARS